MTININSLRCIDKAIKLLEESTKDGGMTDGDKNRINNLIMNAKLIKGHYIRELSIDIASENGYLIETSI